MPNSGALIDALPSTPISVTALEELEKHEAIQRAAPLHERGGADQRITDRILLQMPSAAVILQHEDGGWVVEHHVDGEGKNENETFQEALMLSQVDDGSLDEDMW